MANYITNRVKFTTRGEEILKKVMTENNFDFEKIIPTPKTLLVTSGSEVIEYIDKEGDIDFALGLRGISRKEYNEWNGYEE